MATSYKLTKEQLALSHEELAKDVEMKRALSILKQLDPEVDIHWVKKGTKPAAIAVNRKVIQMEG